MGYGVWEAQEGQEPRFVLSFHTKRGAEIFIASSGKFFKGTLYLGEAL